MIIISFQNFGKVIRSDNPIQRGYKRLIACPIEEWGCSSVNDGFTNSILAVFLHTGQKTLATLTAYLGDRRYLCAVFLHRAVEELLKRKKIYSFDLTGRRRRLRF